jgi:spermidine synthase
MSALSTVGSIVGTIASGFVLISYLPVSRSILLLGLLSCGLGILALRAPRALGTLALGTLLWPGPVAATVLLERDTAYHHIIVEETAERRLLRFNSTLQGSVSLKDPLKGAIPYVYYLHNAFVIAPDVRSALVVGLGTASAPRHMLHYHPRMQEIVVAEIDPVVLEIAKQHFDLPNDPRLRVEIVDGRVFLKRTDRRFDLIFVDAFGANRYGITIPPHLASREFFEEAKRRLTPDGILVFNSPQNLGAAVTNAIYKTLANVFPEVYVFNTPYLSCMLMAVVTPRRLTRDGLVARGKEAEARGTIPHVIDRLEHLSAAPPPDTIAEPLLTDDYAPVELLLRGKWTTPGK